MLHTNKMRSTVALKYSDIFLVPKKCVVNSRKECDTSVSIKNIEFYLPVMPANMAAVISPSTYETYLKNGAIPIMHRFNVDRIKFLRDLRGANWKAISVGVSDDEIDFLNGIVEDLSVNYWPNCICIDIAHGHSNDTKYVINLIKTRFGKHTPTIIAGNVTTPDAVLDLEEWGADIIKVGIGPGHVCSTKNKTGFHVPMFTAVQECARVARVPIIADGGIRENGDIAKALVAGASFVMIGGMFAACTDSPAATVDGKKEYYGSASAHNKGHNNNVEGFTTHLCQTMSIEEKLKEIKQDLQSAISYAGGVSLNALNFVDHVIAK